MSEERTGPNGRGDLVRPRSWVEVRWRQFRRAPRPIVRAVASSLSVAVVLGLAYLAYDVALSRGEVLPGGDLRPLALAGFVVLVALAGMVLTYLLVPQPAGSTGRRTHSGWSAVLGLLAALPIAYIVLVVVVQVVEPLLTRITG